MSVHYLSAVADLSDLPPTCKLVLYGLAVDADGHGTNATTNARLRQRTGLSERAVRATLRSLEQRGLVQQSCMGTELRLAKP